MKLPKFNRFTPFVAGLAIGVTATLLLVREAGGDTRNHIRNAVRRIGDGLKTRAQEPSPEPVGVLGEEMTTEIEIMEGEKA